MFPLKYSDFVVDMFSFFLKDIFLNYIRILVHRRWHLKLSKADLVN